MAADDVGIELRSPEESSDVDAEEGSNSDETARKTSASALEEPRGPAELISFSTYCERVIAALCSAFPLSPPPLAPLPRSLLAFSSAARVVAATSPHVLRSRALLHVTMRVVAAVPSALSARPSLLSFDAAFAPSSASADAAADVALHELASAHFHLSVIGSLRHLLALACTPQSAGATAPHTPAAVLPTSTAGAGAGAGVGTAAETDAEKAADEGPRGIEATSSDVDEDSGASDAGEDEFFDASDGDEDSSDEDTGDVAGRGGVPQTARRSNAAPPPAVPLSPEAAAATSLLAHIWPAVIPSDDVALPRSAPAACFAPHSIGSVHTSTPSAPFSGVDLAPLISRLALGLSGAAKLPRTQALARVLAPATTSTVDDVPAYQWGTTRPQPVGDFAQAVLILSDLSRAAIAHAATASAAVSAPEALLRNALDAMALDRPQASLSLSHRDPAAHREPSAGAEVATHSQVRAFVARYSGQGLVATAASAAASAAAPVAPSASSSSAAAAAARAATSAPKPALSRELPLPAGLLAAIFHAAQAGGALSVLHCISASGWPVSTSSSTSTGSGVSPPVLHPDLLLSAALVHTPFAALLRDRLATAALSSPASVPVPCVRIGSAAPAALPLALESLRLSLDGLTALSLVAVPPELASRVTLASQQGGVGVVVRALVPQDAATLVQARLALITDLRRLLSARVPTPRRTLTPACPFGVSLRVVLSAAHTASALSAHLPAASTHLQPLAYTGYPADWRLDFRLHGLAAGYDPQSVAAKQAWVTAASRIPATAPAGLISADGPVAAEEVARRRAVSAGWGSLLSYTTQALSCVLSLHDALVDDAHSLIGRLPFPLDASP